MFILVYILLRDWSSEKNWLQSNLIDCGWRRLRWGTIRSGCFLPVLNLHSTCSNPNKIGLNSCNRSSLFICTLCPPTHFCFISWNTLWIQLGQIRVFWNNRDTRNPKKKAKYSYIEPHISPILLSTCFINTLFPTAVGNQDNLIPWLYFSRSNLEKNSFQSSSVVPLSYHRQLQTSKEGWGDIK